VDVDLEGGRGEEGGIAKRFVVELLEAMVKKGN